MVNIYVTRIQNGLMTIEEVPMLWREKVRKALAELSGSMA